MQMRRHGGFQPGVFVFFNKPFVLSWIGLVKNLRYSQFYVFMPVFLKNVFKLKLEKYSLGICKSCRILSICSRI